MGRRIRRTTAFALATIAGLVAAGFYLVRDPNPVGHWRSASARARYLTQYDRAFRECPEPTEMRDVRTEFGIVRVYRFGLPRPGVAPVVLVPGRSSGAPMWAGTLSRLGSREAYAIRRCG